MKSTADDLVRVVVNGQRAVASIDDDGNGQVDDTEIPDGTGPYYRVVVIERPGMAGGNDYPWWRHSGRYNPQACAPER